MKRFFKGLILALLTVLCISFIWLLNSIFNESRSIGIIGGADGPTAILVAGPHHSNYKS